MADPIPITPLPLTEATRHPPQDLRLAVVNEARRYLAGAPLSARGLTFSDDPIGFVRAAYWRAGVDLFDPLIAARSEDGVAILYGSAQQRGQLHRQTPRPGDLVFLGTDKTRPQQVAIVEEVDDRGTLALIGRFAGGRARIRLNLRHPQTQERAGVRINDLLQDSTGKWPAAARFLGFADPFRG